MVTAATEAKQATALMDLFVTLWTEKYGGKPAINRYADKWGFIDVVKDVGNARAKELIYFYFEHGKIPGHTVKGFFYNYDKLDKAQKEGQDDDERRAALRAETRRRVEESERNRIEH